MKLLRLKADGFGALRGEFHFSPDRLTLVVDENERGKSTLLAAIVAALYGLDDDRRTHRVLTPAERWRPWDGGAYRVELDIDDAGRRLTVVRDFDRNTVEVWNDRGQEVTAEFREGKDEFPVGRKLTGLDAEEFEKCAFVRQGEIDQVVPGEEKARRASTLHARLENAADTRVGDTNAIEALRVLGEAAASYNCPELDTTLKVDTAIARLETRREYLGTEIRTAEHDLEGVAGPLEVLARLTEDERAVREALLRAEAERRESRWAELRRQLDRHDERQVALEDMRAEAASLESAAGVPADADSELRDLIARFEEKQRALDSLAARRRAAGEERERLENETSGLQVYAACAVQDADRLAARAAEIRRVDREHERLRLELNQSRQTLSERGFELDRIELLTKRFGSLSHQSQDLLRAQPRLALAFQTEVAAIEQTRTGATETLRLIDAIRHRRRVPGWVALALGLGAAAVGGAVGWMQVQWPWMMMLAGGAALAIAGIAILVAGSRVRQADRRAVQARLRDADERLGRIGAQQDEIEGRLAELAVSMSYPGTDGLLREWNDYVRLIEESGPVQEVQQQTAALERQRESLHEEARQLLERAGGGPTDPGHLDLTAGGIRQLHAALERLAEFDKSWGWLDDEQRATEEALEEIRVRAAKLLETAGLRYDRERPWAGHLDALAGRVRAAVRFRLLKSELVPQTERLLLDVRTVEDLRSQLERMTAETTPAGPPGAESAPRPQAEIEAETERLRAALEDMSGRREKLRRDVEKADPLQAQLAEKQTEFERIERALRRARRFKRAVELARETIQAAAFDTHRRWAEFLNVRVGDLLAAVGTQAGQVRFGEDLDFSLRLANGQQVSRGKAVLQLSSGARDQLHLAVRLAISEYLSRGRDALPLLLDDGFASSDDERARAGMKLLIEHFTALHQIIVVTCHRKRHEALAAMDPELYAQRVYWPDPRAARLAG